MAEIRLQGVDKVYPGGMHAVHSADLTIADGEFMIMVGPSGCAKSTILRMIAGLEKPTGGTVSINGQVVNEVAPKDRDLAMVFQSYALYPHMTVRENMAFGLKLRKMPPAEIDARVDEAARILGLEKLLDRLPKAMSGGQRQRVAMGRAIVREPQAFLMDEPLSNLDAKLRVQMRAEIAKLHQRLGTTTVYVTHDQVEALTLGDRICILRAGVIQQVDTPFEVYNNPANIFVAGFIGSPGMNFLPARLSAHESRVYVTIGACSYALPPSVCARLRPETWSVGEQDVYVGIRPEHLSLTANGNGDGSALPINVELVEQMGAEQYVYFGTDVTAVDLSELSDTQNSASSFIAKIDGDSALYAGMQLDLHIDLSRIHIFNPRTQETLLQPVPQVQQVDDFSNIVTTPIGVPLMHNDQDKQFDVFAQSEQPQVGLMESGSGLDQHGSVFANEPVGAQEQVATQEQIAAKEHVSARELVPADEPSKPRGFAARPLKARPAQPNNPKVHVKAEPENIPAKPAQVERVAFARPAISRAIANSNPRPELNDNSAPKISADRPSPFRLALSRLQEKSSDPAFNFSKLGSKLTPPKLSLED